MVAAHRCLVDVSGFHCSRALGLCVPRLGRQRYRRIPVRLAETPKQCSDAAGAQQWLAGMSCSPRLRDCSPDVAARRRRWNTPKPRRCWRTRIPASPMAGAGSEKSTAWSAAITGGLATRPAMRGQRGALASAKRTAADRPAGGHRARRAGHAGGDGTRTARRMRGRSVEGVRRRHREPGGAGLRDRLHPDRDDRAATPTRISSATRSWRCRREKP